MLTKICKGFGLGFFVVVALFAVISLFTLGFTSFITLLLSAFTLGVSFYAMGEVIESLDVLNNNVYAIYRLLKDKEHTNKEEL